MLQETPAQSSSQTAAIIEQLATYGAKPSQDDVDHRLMPEDELIEHSIQALFNATQELFTGSQLEDDVEEILWSMTNIFHRRMNSVRKRVDELDIELKEQLKSQDGSEIKSVELERTQDRSAKLWEQYSTYELMRDIASQHFAVETGSAWMPRTGSKISNRNLTASVVDGKSYLMAKRRKENETLCPEGTRIAFGGGDYNDHQTIWDVLDATKQKYPDMILLHGGSPKGAELIASKWADSRNVTQVVFKPDWKADNRAAPFKRNDKLLATVPQGLIITPGTGITENLADKAKKLGIRIKRLGG